MDPQLIQQILAYLQNMGGGGASAGGTQPFSAGTNFTTPPAGAGAPPTGAPPMGLDPSLLNQILTRMQLATSKPGSPLSLGAQGTAPGNQFGVMGATSAPNNPFGNSFMSQYDPNMGMNMFLQALNFPNTGTFGGGIGAPARPFTGGAGFNNAPSVNTMPGGAGAGPYGNLVLNPGGGGPSWNNGAYTPPTPNYLQPGFNSKNGTDWGNWQKPAGYGTTGHTAYGSPGDNTNWGEWMYQTTGKILPGYTPPLNAQGGVLGAGDEIPGGAPAARSRAAGIAMQPPDKTMPVR